MYIFGIDYKQWQLINIKRLFNLHREKTAADLLVKARRYGVLLLWKVIWKEGSEKNGW